MAVALVQPQYGILRLSSFFFVLNLFYSSSYSYTSGGGADSVDLRYITFFFLKKKKELPDASNWCVYLNSC